jgi:hypothetical protein
MAGKADSEVGAMNTALSALSGLETDEKRRILVWLIDKLKMSGSVSLGNPVPAPGTPIVPSPPASPAGNVSGTESTPKQFMASKKPKSDAERITCLAYFLTHQRGTAQFKTKDLTALNTEAAGSPFSNAAVAVNNAALSNYLAAAGGGAKQITARGEALVEALPDREKVTAALEENPARKRKPKKANKPSKRKPA